MPASSATASGLATRYATALFELARERNQLDEVARDLDAISALLTESDDLGRLVRSPVLSREEQGRAVTALAERIGTGEIVRGLLGVLAGNRRLFALEPVIRAFRARLAEARGEVEAELVSAQPLADEQAAAIEQSLKKFTGRAVNLARTVDPSLLGGLVVRVGSRMVDASLRTKLQQLEVAMRGIG